MAETDHKYCDQTHLHLQLQLHQETRVLGNCLMTRTIATLQVRVNGD